MANQLSQNPIIIVSPLVPSYKAAVSSTIGTLFTLLINKIVWQGAGAQGNVALITDPANGNNRVRLIAQGLDIPQIVDWTADPQAWSDFAVPQIDSGILQIYTR